jgi:hypothetical protein
MDGLAALRTGMFRLLPALANLIRFLFNFLAGFMRGLRNPLGCA